MSEEQDKSPFETRKCHICGNDDYTWGHLEDTGHVIFTPKGVSGFKAAFGIGKSHVSARVCKTCGNTQMFVNVPVDK